MSDAAAIAKMTPEQIATAIGGSLILITESECDVCERAPDKTGHDHYLLGFRAGDVTASGIYCFACLQTVARNHVHEQSLCDRILEVREGEA